MSNNNTHRERLLSEGERELLSNSDVQSNKTRDELLTELKYRVWNTFNDIELLYMTLTTDEIEELFGKSDSTYDSTRAHAQHVFAFLYYGLKQTDDNISHRIASAIKEAEAADDCDATVTLDIVTQPFLPPEQLIQVLEDGNFDQVSIGALNRMWHDERFSPVDVVDVFSALGETELTVEDVKEERERTARFERIPSTVITDVEVSSAATESDKW